MKQKSFISSESHHNVLPVSIESLASNLAQHSLPLISLGNTALNSPYSPTAYNRDCQVHLLFVCLPCAYLQFTASHSLPHGPSGITHCRTALNIDQLLSTLRLNPIPSLFLCLAFPRH